MRSRKAKRPLSHSIKLRLYEEDIERLQQQAQNSPYRKLSVYCRMLLLGKPATLFSRDRSLDALLDEAIVLRKELVRVRMGMSGTNGGYERLVRIEEEIIQVINKIYDHVSQNKRTQGRA